MGYKKNLTNPFSYRLYSNSPTDLFNHTMTNLMDNFYDSAMTEETDGSFKAVCLSGIRTEDNSGGGPDLEDGRQAEGHLFVVVKPLTSFGNILPDPLNVRTGEELLGLISLYSTTFVAKSDFEFKDTDVPKFGQILNCYFEDGSIIRSNFKGLRFSKPTGEQIEENYKKLTTLKPHQSLQEAFFDGYAVALGEGSDDYGPFLSDGTTVSIPDLQAEVGKSTNIRKDRTKEIEYIVIHYSAAIGTKKAVLKHENTYTKYGYHYMIDRDGSYYESAPINKIVWHAGGNKTVKNSNSVGICIMNIGFDRIGLAEDLKKYKTKAPPLSDWKLGKFPNKTDNTVVKYANNNGKWEPYTPESLYTAAKICAAILDDKGLTTDAIKGHSDIQTDKQDPGPAFDMQAFKSMVRSHMVT